MLVQLLSDLHLETEVFEPEPAPGAELLVLGGDIDATWHGYERFRDWPVPVIAVAGNHEFDGRDLCRAWSTLRARLDALGIDLLEREEREMTDGDGRRIRVLGSVRWSDFDLFGPAGREAAMRAAAYFMTLMRAADAGQPFDAPRLREQALQCREWLAASLASNAATCDATLVVTHFAPSLRSADPRFGTRASTASFCNDDTPLIGCADVWLHGHLHCRHDYVEGRTRVVSNARGLASKGEADGFDGHCLVAV